MVRDCVTFRYLWELLLGKEFDNPIWASCSIVSLPCNNIIWFQDSATQTRFGYRSRNLKTESGSSKKTTRSNRILNWNPADIDSKFCTDYSFCGNLRRKFSANSQKWIIHSKWNWLFLSMCIFRCVMWPFSVSTYQARRYI